LGVIRGAASDPPLAEGRDHRPIVRPPSPSTCTVSLLLSTAVAPLPMIGEGASPELDEAGVAELVAPAAFVAHEHCAERMAATTGPADAASRVSNHDSVSRHVVRDHCSRTRHRPGADAYSTHHHGMRSDRGPALHHDSRDHPVGLRLQRPFGRRCSRVAVIGQAGARTYEHLIFEHRSVIQERIALYLAATANLDVEIDEHVLADDAVIANRGAATEV